MEERQARGVIVDITAMAYVVGVDAMVTPKEILLRNAGSDRVELRTLHAPTIIGPGFSVSRLGLFCSQETMSSGAGSSFAS